MESGLLDMEGEFGKHGDMRGAETGLAMAHLHARK
jgi:hypothetical protein